MVREQNELIGALIGLGRAVWGNPTSPETDRVMLDALGIAAGSGDPEALNRAALAVREEKFKAVPNCRTCAAPCGRTSDYDLALLTLEPADRQAAKRVLLRAMLDAAAAGTGTAAAFYDALAAIPEELPPGELISIAEKLK